MADVPHSCFKGTSTNHLIDLQNTVEGHVSRFDEAMDLMEIESSPQDKAHGKDEVPFFAVFQQNFSNSNVESSAPIIAIRPGPGNEGSIDPFNSLSGIYQGSKYPTPLFLFFQHLTPPQRYLRCFSKTLWHNAAGYSTATQSLVS
jgi:hypothetical protein